jgi:DNA polymerase-3 subunit epsilon
MNRTDKSHIDGLQKYWLSYLNVFKKKPTMLSEETNFIVFDTETTGFDFELDRIISIGAICVQKLEIAVASSFEIYIKQERFNPATVEFHGIIKNEKIETLTEVEALERFLEYIGNAVLVAHHANFDVTMINMALKRNGLPKLKNKVLDTVYLYRATRIKSNLLDKKKKYSLDEIAENYDIDVSDRHTAAGDALITAIIFLKTLSRLNKSRVLTIKELLRVR